MTLDLYNQAKALGNTVYLGPALTIGVFYPSKTIPCTQKQNADTGALFVEMEIATLFVIGTMKGVRTAAIAVADGNIFAENEYDPHGTVVANGKV